MFKEICRPCIVAIGISLGATPITCMALEDNLIYNAGNSDFVSQDNTECLNSLDGIWLGTPNGIYESNGRRVAPQFFIGIGKKMKLVIDKVSLNRTAP